MLLAQTLPDPAESAKQFAQTYLQGSWEFDLVQEAGELKARTHAVTRATVPPTDDDAKVAAVEEVTQQLWANHVALDALAKEMLNL